MPLVRTYIDGETNKKVKVYMAYNNITDKGKAIASMLKNSEFENGGDDNV